MHQGKSSADVSQQSGRGKKSLGSESSGPGDHWGMQDEEEVGAENEPEEETVGPMEKEHTVEQSQILESQSSRLVGFLSDWLAFWT